MTRKFRVAIIGSGIGARHVTALERLTDRFEIAVIADADIGRAQALADKVVNGPRPQACGAFDDALLARADIDIIDICTPPFLHADMIRRALNAGKHVVCEKPLVGSLADLDELDALARSRKLTLMPVFQYRFGHGLAKAKHLMATGAAGKIYTATVETHWTRGPDYYAVAWRGKKQTELGGVFLGHAIHAHDMLTYLCGEVRGVRAATTARVNPIETEDCAGAIFEMADGSIAVSSATLGSADEISRIRICCENVTMVSNLDPYIPSRDPWTFIPKKPKDEAFIEASLAGAKLGRQGYTGQFSLYHEALMTSGALPITMTDGRRSIELVSAIYHAAKSGERVELPIQAGHPVYKGWL